MTNPFQNKNNSDEEIKIWLIINGVLKNWKIIAAVPLMAAMVAMAVGLLMPPKFTAKTLFLPPLQQQSSASALLQSLGAMGSAAGAAAGIKNPADQYVGFLKSTSILDALSESFDLKNRYGHKLKTDTRVELISNTRVTVGKDGIITLEFEDKDPKFAADIANSYVQELRKFMGRMSLTEAQLRRNFFEGKFKEARDALTLADQELRATGINASTLKSSPSAAVEVVARLKAGIVAQELKISGLRGTMASSAPEVKQAVIELLALKSQLTNAEKSEILPEGQSNYVEKYRKYKYQETLFELFAKQYELARIDEGREGAIVQVVDMAEVPEKKSKPKIIVFGLIAYLLTLLITVTYFAINIFVKQKMNFDNKNNFLQ